MNDGTKVIIGLCIVAVVVVFGFIIYSKIKKTDPSTSSGGSTTSSGFSSFFSFGKPQYSVPVQCATAGTACMGDNSQLNGECLGKRAFECLTTKLFPDNNDKLQPIDTIFTAITPPNGKIAILTETEANEKIATGRVAYTKNPNAYKDFATKQEVDSLYETYKTIMCGTLGRACGGDDGDVNKRACYACKAKKCIETGKWDDIPVEQQIEKFIPPKGTTPVMSEQEAYTKIYEISCKENGDGSPKANTSTAGPIKPSTGKSLSIMCGILGRACGGDGGTSESRTCYACKADTCKTTGKWDGKPAAEVFDSVVAQGWPIMSESDALLKINGAKASMDSLAKMGQGPPTCEYE